MEQKNRLDATKLIPSIDVCALLLLPSTEFSGTPTPSEVARPKDRPYFYDFDIEFQTLEKKKLSILGTEVSIHMQVLDDTVWLAECRYTLQNPWSPDAVNRKYTLQQSIWKELVGNVDYMNSVYEEYTILLVDHKTKKPSSIIDAHAPLFATLIRSLEKPLEDTDAENTLKTRVRYSDSDVIVVDWEGAIIVGDQSESQSDIDLLKIGNYQLLRYRMLDNMLDTSLESLQELVSGDRKVWFSGKESIMYDIVNQRLALILGFEKVNQSLLLIGDWYSAQVYRAIVDEFFIKDWQEIVSNKLHHLGEIYEIVTQNLTYSWGRILDLVQIVGWMILLVGYFVLFFVELQ